MKLGVRDRVQAVQGFAPDHDRLVARGLDARVEPDGEFAAALVQIVKSKGESLSLVAEALTLVRPGGVIAVDGPRGLKDSIVPSRTISICASFS